MRIAPGALALVASLAILLAGGSAAEPGCQAREITASAVQVSADVRALVTCAHEFVLEAGEDAAYQAFHESERWNSGEIYVFVLELKPSAAEARILVHPAFRDREGSTWGELGDDFGDDIIKEAARLVSANGSGWWYYQFTNPTTGNSEPKASYVMAIDWKGIPAYIGAGVYERDLPGACNADQVNASMLAAAPSNRHLEEFVRCAAYRVEAEGYFAKTKLETDMRWRSGPIYVFALDTMGNQVLSGNMARVNGIPLHEFGTWGGAADQFGGRDMPSVVGTFGESYIYYRSSNPVTGAIQRKTAFMKRVTANGVPLLVGAGYYRD